MVGPSGEISIDDLVATALSPDGDVLVHDDRARVRSRTDADGVAILGRRDGLAKGREVATPILSHDDRTGVGLLQEGRGADHGPRGKDGDQEGGRQDEGGACRRRSDDHGR